MNKNLIKIAKQVADLKRQQDKLVQKAKSIFDNGSFIRPLSEFFDEDDDCFGYGLWLSGEGDTMINEMPIADYYDNYSGTQQFQKFCKQNHLSFEWWDAGTITCYMD